MKLALALGDKIQLWAVFIHSRSDRVFVPTTESPRIGSEVEVEVTVAGLPAALQLTGAVIGIRPPSEPFPGGAFVRFDESQVARCRAALGLDSSGDPPLLGRRVSRADCELPVRFLEPQQTAPATARNLSETGLLVKSAGSFEEGQKVRLSLGLDDASDLELTASVSWRRPELSLLGLELTGLAEAQQAKLEQAVRRLATKARASDSRRTVLVAEDEESVMRLLTTFLTKKGLEVHGYSRGDEAFQQVRKLRPGLVLLDVLMPGMDGKEVCKRMRADADMAKIPVILMSALDRAGLYSVAQEAGASDYLSKPLSLADLGKMVGKYLA